MTDTFDRERSVSCLRKVFLINVLILGMMVLISSGFYETNDDNYLSAIIYGAWGNSASNVVYINSLLSTLLYVIHNSLPSVPVYYIFQLLLILASLTIVSYVVVKKSSSRSSYLMITAFALFFGYECYVKMQYTKTAAIATLAGLCLLFMLRDKNVWHMIGGMLLSYSGFLLRKESFILISAILLPNIVC